MFTGQFRARGNGNFLVERSSSSILETLRDNSRTIVGGNFNANLAEMRVRFPGYIIGLSVTQPMYLEALGLAWQGLELVLRLAGWIMF